MRFIFVIIGLLLAAQQGAAGPWPRERGQVFTAQGGNFLLSDGAQLPVHYDPTFYAEYGLTELMTVGLDYHTADQGRIHTGFAFLSFPLGDTDARDRYAASLGYGARIDEYSPLEWMVRGGFSWGRGLDNGWLAIDTTASYGTVDQSFRPKADFTWGHHLNDRWTVSLQLQTGEGYSDDYYAKISPAISFALNDEYRVSIGAVQGLTGDQGSALKVELWRTHTFGRKELRALFGE